MEPENSGSTVVALQVKKHNFLDTEIQLAVINRELNNASKAAISALVGMLESKDEKLKMQAAVKLLEFGIDVKKAISQDQMQRLIAEIKLNGTSGTRTLELQPGQQRPVVDFATIRQP